MKQRRQLIDVSTIVFTIVLIFGVYIVMRALKEEFSDPVKIESVVVSDDFQDHLLELIFEIKLEHPYIVIAQAILESGNYQSQIFRENNNLFGMKMPYRRSTLAVGINKGHAVFKSWKHSVYDYGLYQMAYMRGMSENEYLDSLNRTYAEDGKYKDKLLTILKRIR